MTAPDLVEVVAEVIAKERGLAWASHEHRECARAVLAALAEAGNVEWGIRYGDGDIDEGYLYKSEALTDIARLREHVQLGNSPADGNEPMTLLTRRRFEHTGPWTAVTK